MPSPTKPVAAKTLSIEQVATKLGVARLHVWRLVDQGEIPSVVIDGEKRIEKVNMPAIRNMFTKGAATVEDFIAGRPRGMSGTVPW